MSKEWESPSFYFDEDNFKEYMSAKVAPWISRFCMEGYMYNREGLKLHYHYFIHPNPLGTIVICHGFCEGFFKYHEVMYYFYQAGYSVFLLEMRGHGYSERQVKNRSMVHVDDFGDYVEDFKEFLDQVVIPMTNHRRLILFCHSMGGCVGSLFLERHPNYFEKAILSSPMLRMRWNDAHPRMIRLMLGTAKFFHWKKHYMPKQHDFVKENHYPNCSAQSKARYDYQFRLRVAHLEYRTSGGDFAWGIAAYHGMQDAIDEAAKIQIPVLLLQAGDDDLVAASGHEEFLQKNPSVTFRSFPKARHEIFNAFSEDRLSYYREVFGFIEDENV